LHDYVEDRNCILNLGCGKNFNLEKYLKSKFKKTSITSCDRIDFSEKATFSDEFMVKSVEENFKLEKEYDVIVFFELIEHIDKTDVLLRNCYRNLKKGGYLIFSFPNLANLYNRISFLLGFQPYNLEVSNEYSNFGQGLLGKINNPEGIPVHHIRGFTHKAMKELVKYHGFNIIKTIGYEYRTGYLLKFIPSLAPINIFVCKK
jgi:SAM-dependent methyltransferase